MMMWLQGATTAISADDSVLTFYGYSQAKMDSAVLAERQKWVANDEDQSGLEEAVRSLQVVSEIE